jgi:hypothetical protein
MSKRAQVRELFDAINQVALPGDLVFQIKEYHAPAPLRLRAKKVLRRCLGYDYLDNTIWHTSVYSDARKESAGATVRPCIWHTGRTHVKEDHIPPAYFMNEPQEHGYAGSTSRVEIGRLEGITDEQQCKIMQYCRSMIGKPFGEDGLTYTFWTYMLGLPALFSTNRKISCQAYVYFAYAYAGIDFPHHLEYAPIFNLAKKRGYPLGHPSDKVNLRFPYLEDHHLYRDDRVTILLAAYQDKVGQALVSEPYPEKYSWNPKLKQVYKAQGLRTAVPARLAAL